MFAVGRLGSYISKGVYTVSGPFHPFGGAVDIVVVEQPDGTFRSSPWYVRFGKFQGVLKATENFVRINVNGVDADFHMYLDHKGEAFFLREVEAVEGESEHYASSGDESDVNADLWKAQKSRSYNFDANRSDLVSELESDNGKGLARNNSRRGRLFGLSFGRRSMKENGFRGEEVDPGVDRVTSMERAEIAADLLEVRWTTNLRVGPPKLPPSKSAVDEANSNDVAEDGLKRDVCDTKLSQKTNDYKTEGSASYSEEHSNSENRLQGGSVSVNDEGLSCSSDRPVAGKFGTSANDKLVEDACVKSMVDEDVSSGIVSINEQLSESYSDRTDPYLSRFLDEGKPSAEVPKAPLSLDVEECLRDSALERKGNLTLSNDSEDEQFSFSDLDVQKVDKNADQNFQIESSSPDSKECLLQDSCESSEDEVTETKCSDDKSNLYTSNLKQVDIVHPGPKESSNSSASPINITKLHKDIDEQALTSIAESMPNMLSDGDGLSSNGAPQLLGHSLDSNLEAIKIVKDALAGSECNTPQQKVDNVRLKTDSYQISEDIKTIFSDPAVEVSLCRHFLYEGMGYEAAAVAFDAEKLDLDEFSSLGHEIVKNDKLVVRIGGLYFPWDAALPIASAIGSQEQEQMLEPRGMIAVGQVDIKTSEGVTQKSVSSRSGSWKLWPFSFKRSNSMQGECVDSEPASESRSVKGDSMDAVGPRAVKKKIRAKFPTSEQLASLKLKEGKNDVTFTFSTAMLGKQQVDARIFLWKWNTRIVISDVDGTITKSDVLGQFMPLMGMDWSQTGVTHLFSAIKENGYQLLFLSARSISQAYHTRQFLFNLKQEGKELPEGPVLISPDGLFPSLYREVIRRAPHEFKISCLEDIKVLFPSDHNPFYAGFGNRDTDEISYLRVGIPIGKIFIINPKGQVAVNRRVDTKSYSSLHDLVHGMFPPAPATEQEDYNSWNFWRLPPPDVI